MKGKISNSTESVCSPGARNRLLGQTSGLSRYSPPPPPLCYNYHDGGL